MKTVLVTGSGGLVGSAAVRRFLADGFRVVGIDNDMRSYFFGSAASTMRTSEELEHHHADFDWYRVDIRDAREVSDIMAGSRPELIVHAAAQPAHDWAVREPRIDFGVNAVGTLTLLEAARRYVPEATFVYCSTSKVYGDHPNNLPLEIVGDRLDLPEAHRFYEGIDTSMSIDQCTHSLFGASKASADLMVQEYGRYFGMATVCFRPGCISGAGHEGAELHGFLSYLMRCTITGKKYTIYGYEGNQVRCNIHAEDLVEAFAAFHAAPRHGGAVFNIGGGRGAACSMWEAIRLCSEIAGRELEWRYSERARIGDHRWWISDNRPFQRAYPEWSVKHDVAQVLGEIYKENMERWSE